MLIEGIKGKYEFGVFDRKQVTVHRTNVFLKNLGIDVCMEDAIEDIARNNSKLTSIEMVRILKKIGITPDEYRSMYEANFEVDWGQK